MGIERRPTYTRRGLAVRGAITAVVGVLLMIFTGVMAELVVELFLASLTIKASIDVLARLRRDHGRYTSLWWDLLKVAGFATLAWSDYFSMIPVIVLVFLIGAYELLLAIINAITWSLYRDNGISPRWRYLLSALWLGALGVATLASPSANLSVQLLLLGGYLVLRGLSDLRDAAAFNREAASRRAGRRLRISLPIVVAALIPRAALAKVNAVIAEAPEPQGDLVVLELEAPKEQAEPHLEVFVHVTPSGFGAIGHVDLAYDGVLWSYGSYDPSSQKLGGAIGDGVLFKVDRQRYLEFCTEHEAKTLFGYGIALNQAQRSAVEARLAELDAQLRPWEPPLPAPGKTPRYARRLREATGAKLFKFTGGKYKTYFVMSTNCVLLADSIIGRAGTDILSAAGFIAPGTYQDYLDREFDRPGSLVVTKRAYTDATPE